MFNDRYGLTQAVIEGRKTVTRREPIYTDSNYSMVSFIPDGPLKKGYTYLDFYNAVGHKCRYFIGEVVAVSQNYESAGLGFIPNRYDGYKWGNPKRMKGWRNKMFVRAELMPHRIRITNIRCERLQDISDVDCLKEGIRFIPEIDKFYFEDVRREEGFYFNTSREAFASLIDKVSGRGTWERNPWVVVYEFETVKL